MVELCIINLISMQMKLLLVFSLLVLSSAYANAQQSKSTERKGLVIGFATGIANSQLTLQSKK
jgi:hypothetical protein